MSEQTLPTSKGMVLAVFFTHFTEEYLQLKRVKVCLTIGTKAHIEENAVFEPQNLKSYNLEPIKTYIFRNA